jgi:hypothetical protein
LNNIFFRKFSDSSINIAQNDVIQSNHIHVPFVNCAKPIKVSDKVLTIFLNIFLLGLCISVVTGGRRGTHMGYWWESQKKRDHWEDQDLGGWTILK